jgi:hypothetical protein
MVITLNNFLYEDVWINDMTFTNPVIGKPLRNKNVGLEADQVGRLDFGIEVWPGYQTTNFYLNESRAILLP